MNIQSGAHGRDRTDDPHFTKVVLCQLSYVGKCPYHDSNMDPGLTRFARPRSFGEKENICPHHDSNMDPRFRKPVLYPVELWGLRIFSFSPLYARAGNLCSIH